MNKDFKKKILAHLINLNQFSESEIEEFSMCFNKNTQIFYCDKCSTNIFNNPRKSIISGNLSYSHPKCKKCNSYMSRLVINSIDEDCSIQEFLRKPRPKIYCYISSENNIADGDVITTAISEDGYCLLTHYSSSKYWGKHDIGITSFFHHERYSEKYPKGFELIWVKIKDIDTHEGLQKAFKLNGAICVEIAEEA